MITKRMIGLSLVLFSLVVVGGVLAVDMVGAGTWSGLGPAQLLTLRLALVLFVIGLSLVPLGNRPA